jgi:hypothetical protein
MRRLHDESEDEYLRHLKIDMDVRTIGTLVETDANDAAFDVCHWVRHMCRVGYDSTKGKSLQNVEGKRGGLTIIGAPSSRVSAAKKKAGSAHGIIGMSLVALRRTPGPAPDREKTDPCQDAVV